MPRSGGQPKRAGAGRAGPAKGLLRPRFNQSDPARSAHLEGLSEAESKADGEGKSKGGEWKAAAADGFPVAR